jgi:hypothetical protein
MEKLVIKKINFWSYIKGFAFVGVLIGLTIVAMGVVTTLLGLDYSFGTEGVIFQGFDAILMSLLQLPLLFAGICIISGTITYIPVTYVIRKSKILSVHCEYTCDDKGNN